MKVARNVGSGKTEENMRHVASAVASWTMALGLATACLADTPPTSALDEIIVTGTPFSVSIGQNGSPSR